MSIGDRPDLFEALLPQHIASNCLRMIRIRWWAGGMVLVATALATRILEMPLPEVSLYVLGAAMLAYNGVLWWLTQRASAANATLHLRRVRRIVVLQVALDWLGMGLFLHFTGGITSPAIPMLLLHMLLVTVLLPNHQPYLYGVLGLAIMSGIAILEAKAVISHHRVISSLPPDLHGIPVYIFAELTFFAITAFATIYLTSFVMERLRSRERQLAALLETIESASSSLEPSLVLNSLARTAAEALGMRKASVRVLDETGEVLAMTASYGLSQDYLDKGPVELEHSPLDREAMAGRYILVNDTSAEPRVQYPLEIRAEGIHSMLVVPIQGRSRILGVLRVYSEQPACFTQSDAAFAAMLAREGANALENAQTHESLRRTEQSRAQFVRTITHELRAPVGAAQSLLRTLLKGLAGDLTAQQADVLGRLELRLDALMRLIDDLLALAASSNLDFQPSHVRVSASGLLREVVDQFSQQAQEKKIALTLQMYGDALGVIATEDGLRRVLENLLNNALKYTLDGGQVTVHAVERLGKAIITIEDTGIGIAEGDFERLWEPFWRGSNARASGIPGTGLGLTIVKRLVESFGGTISLHSREGRGTTVRVSLPLAESDELVRA